MAPSYAPDAGGDPTGRDRPTGTVDALVAAARRRESGVLLEGVHALKHAVRFGAGIELVLTPDAGELRRLLAELAPDVVLPVEVTEVDATQWRRLVPRDLPSPVLAVARRPADTFAEVLASRTGRVVVLEHPRHLGNLGAAVRVAAAAGAPALAVVGEADPWHPTAVRSAAGLQFALAVTRLDELPPTSRPLVAIDPDGQPLGDRGLDEDAVLLFGTERAGLSPALRARADRHVAIPMRPGVSSLNLATAVGIVLYAR
jgi:RNA methyltransferase, TrmH family